MGRPKKSEAHAEPGPMALVVAVWRVPGEGWRHVVEQVPVETVQSLGKAGPPEIRSVAVGRALEALERWET